MNPSLEELGNTLREARERLGLTQAEVERAIRIRAHHLEAMERGDFEKLPSPVQARGFLYNYADFLGLDADALVMKYAGTLRSARKKPSAQKTLGQMAPRPSVRVRSSPRRWFSFDMLIAGLVGIAVLAVLIWGIGRVRANLRTPEELAAAGGENPTPTWTSEGLPTDALLLGTWLPGTETLETPTPSPPAPVVIEPSNLVNVHLQIEKSAWVQVFVDGAQQFSGRLFEGDARDFQGRQEVKVITGNGAGVHVIFNGQDEGLLGGIDEVVIRIWTLGGMLTPTPTITPTPTPTPAETQVPQTTPTP
jgi:transcriptional regulator with XRE-family HTH domain